MVNAPKNRPWPRPASHSANHPRRSLRRALSQSSPPDLPPSFPTGHGYVADGVEADLARWRAFYSPFPRSAQAWHSRGGERACENAIQAMSSHQSRHPSHASAKSSTPSQPPPAHHAIPTSYSINFLYLNLLGSSSPRRFFLFSSYSE